METKTEESMPTTETTQYVSAKRIQAIEEAKKASQSLVLHLRSLHNFTQLEEEDAKTIFEKYDIRKKQALTMNQLRLFLQDVEESFGGYRVISEENLHACQSVIQSSVYLSVSIEWHEFRGFLLQTKSPFHFLHKKITSITPNDAVRSILVYRIHLNADVSHLTKLLGDIVTARIFLVKNEHAQVAQAFIVLKEISDVQVALVQLHGADLMNRKLKAVVFTNQSFPIRIKRPSLVAFGLAPAVLLGQKAMNTVNAVDEKLHLSSCVKNQMNAMDHNLGISQRIKTTTQTVSNTADLVATTLHVKPVVDTVTNVTSEAARRTSDAIKNNTAVKAGVGLINTVVNKVTSTVDDIAEDTMEIIAEKNEKKLTPAT